MKILGYELRPRHALYAGLTALAVGCGGSDAPYEFENSKTEQMYTNVKENMKLHGRLKHPGKWSAILLKAASRDTDMANPLTLEDLQWVIDSEIKRGDEIYDWEDFFAPEKKETPGEASEESK